MHSEDKDCFMKLFSVIHVYISEVLNDISTSVAIPTFKNTAPNNVRPSFYVS